MAVLQAGCIISAGSLNDLIPTVTLIFWLKKSDSTAEKKQIELHSQKNKPRQPIQRETAGCDAAAPVRLPLPSLPCSSFDGICCSHPDMRLQLLETASFNEGGSKFREIQIHQEIPAVLQRFISFPVYGI